MILKFLSLFKEIQIKTLSKLSLYFSNMHDNFILIDKSVLEGYEALK